MYIIEFNDFEKNIFNTIETVKKTKLMSVYCSMVLYSTDNTLSISMSKLLKRYKNANFKRWKERKISLAYLKQLINDLEKLGLIKIDKTNKINSYFIPRVAEKVAEKVADEKLSESIDIPNVANDEEVSNIGVGSNIYNNTPNTQLNKKYGEIVPGMELVYFAKMFMKELRIRSKRVKDEVIKKLANCMNVNRAGMEKYVLKVIIEKKAKQELRRQQFSKGKNIAISKFLDRNRKEYSHGEIERKFGIIV